MITLPNMGLKAWNLLTDPYDSSQLADNWQKVDQHDHSGGRGVQIASGGIQDGAITSSKLASNLAVPPAAGSVTLASLGSDVSTDYGYAFTSYKDIFSYTLFPGNLANAVALTGGTTYGVSLSSISASAVSGNNLTAAYILYLDPADRAAGTNRTVYHRYRIWYTTNAATPGTWTFTMAPISTTITGISSNSNSYGFGAAVTGSTVSFTPVASSGRTIVTGADFAAPAAGHYVTTFLSSTTMSNAGTQEPDIRITLQTRTA